MRLSLIHLSDIHFRAENDAAERLIPRIAGSLPLSTNEADAIVVLVSGDITQSSEVKQYKQARRTFDSLRESLTEQFPSVAKIYTICAPGNHDALLNPEDSIRNTLIENLPAEIDSPYIEKCSDVQLEFRAFRNSLPGSPQSTSSTPLQESYDLELENGSVRVDVFNTAWMSLRDEPYGRIRMPSAHLAAPPAGASVAIAMFHHPYPWFDRDHVQEFVRLIEANYDVVLTGHEHEGDAYRKTRTLSNVDYLEGDVFQQSPSRATGGFRLVQIDTEKHRFRTSLLDWHRKRDTYRETREIETAPFLRNAARLRSEFVFQPSMQGFLTDPGESFLHPRKSSLQLEDILIEPDCRVRRMSILSTDSSPRKRLTPELILELRNAAIVAPESAGKTTLCKWLVQQVLRRGIVPLLVRGADLLTADASEVEDHLEERLRKTYESDPLALYRSLPANRRAVIVDDLDRSPLPWADRLALLRVLRGFAQCVVFTTKNEPLIEIADSIRDRAVDTSVLDAFALIQPLELGAERRYELVKKWCSIGVVYSDQESNLDRQVMTRQSMLTSIISKKIISVYPIYVLLCLQQLELAERPEIGGGSFGYLYESLLTLSLGSVRSSLDLDLRHNFLAEFAEELRTRDTPYAQWTEFVAIVERYNSRYDTLVTANEIVDATASVLVHEDSRVRFRHRFAYYYYVARFINNRFSSDARISLVESYADQLHNELAGNVLMFLCHLSKGGPVLDIVLQRASSLLEKAKPLDFEKDVARLGTSAEEPIRLLDKPVDARRKELYAKRDDADELESNVQEEFELVSQLNAAIKCTQIIGQILRGFHGSIPAERKRQLAEGAYLVMLRMLGAWAEWASNNRGEVITLLSDLLRERSDNITDTEAEQEAERLLLFLMESFATFGILNVAESLGRAALMRTFESVLGKHVGKTGVQLIDMAIRMQSADRFPTEDVVKQMRTLKSQFAKNVLRRLVARHVYLFPLDYTDRQKVCSATGIEWVEPPQREKQFLLRAPPKKARKRRKQPGSRRS